jgi:hypothetical protein
LSETREVPLTVEEVTEVLEQTSGCRHGAWVVGPARCTLCGSWMWTSLTLKAYEQLDSFECESCGMMEAKFVIVQGDDDEDA